MVWIVDEAGILRACNKSLSEVFKRPQTEFVGRPISSAIGPDLAELCLANRNKIDETGRPQRFVQSMGDKADGNRTFLVDEFSLGTMDGKKLYGGIALDISFQKQNEEELRQSQQRLTRLNRLYLVHNQLNETIIQYAEIEELLNEVCRILVEEAGIALVWICKEAPRGSAAETVTVRGEKADDIAIDLKGGPAAQAMKSGRPVVCNALTDDVFAQQKESTQALDLHSCAAFPFRFRDKQACLLVYAHTTQFFEEEEQRLFQSLVKELEYALNSLASQDRVHSTQAELRASQQRMANLFKNLPGMAYQCRNDSKWTMEFVSEGSLTLTGFPPEDLVHNRVVSFEELILPEDRQRVRDEVNKALENRQPFEINYRLLHRSQGERWVWERGLAFYDVNGSISRLEGFISDVTEQHQAYSRLERQAELIAQARDAIIVCNEDGIVEFWNNGAERLYGYQASQTLGRPIHLVLKPEDETALKEAIYQVRTQGEWIGELQRIAADGSVKTVESRWTVVQSAEFPDKTILSIDTDITERKELEKQFIRAQRMESVGTLAGGIAHDLNNILSPITMATELLEDSVTGDEEKLLLKRIDDGARRAADLIQQLLSFSRGLDSTRKPVEVATLLENWQNLISDSLTKNMSLNFISEGPMPQILANPVQISQVLLNLIVNARDAMDGKGTLTVTVSQEERRITPPDIPQGTFLVMEVTDTGPGIPEELREKIFEPFFSTKGEARGTGLGLSTTLSIVRNHGGFIELQSREGEGCKFRVHLPVLGVMMETKPESPAWHGESQDDKTLMVVDDEASMRTALTQILQACGYSVLTAKNGRDALNQIEADEKRSLDCVLTDIQMPLMNGLELRKILREKFPQLPVIGMSGFHNLPQNAPGEGIDQFDGFLSKPFKTEQLLEILRQKIRR